MDLYLEGCSRVLFRWSCMVEYDMILWGVKVSVAVCVCVWVCGVSVVHINALKSA